MNNFKKYFKNKAFIPFITAGDPNLDVSEKLIDKLIIAGSTIIEIGIPFSDPVAEGKTIERADTRALLAGTTTDKIFDFCKKISEKHKDFPFVFMTYINPVFTYGYEKFFKKAKLSGIKGIIIPDLPFEESHEVKDIARKYDVTLISLIAPTSKDRIKMIASEAEGFVYLVSSLGVTGVRDNINTNINEMVLEIKKYTDIPVCVGFGIKNAETAKKMTEIADGAIVGSAIVNLVEKYNTLSPDMVYSFAKEIVDGITI